MVKPQGPYECVQVSCAHALTHSLSRGPVSSKILWAGVATYKTLKFKARADLILGRVEYGQRVREEPAAEGRQGELVPDNLGQ